MVQSREHDIAFGKRPSRLTCPDFQVRYRRWNIFRQLPIDGFSVEFSGRTGTGAQRVNSEKRMRVADEGDESLADLALAGNTTAAGIPVPVAPRMPHFRLGDMVVWVTCEG